MLYVRHETEDVSNLKLNCHTEVLETVILKSNLSRLQPLIVFVFTGFPNLKERLLLLMLY